MKQVIQHIGKQAPHIKMLIKKMIEAEMSGRDTLSILHPKITKDEINWLRKNDFEPEFNEQTKEWEIPLN